MCVRSRGPAVCDIKGDLGPDMLTGVGMSVIELIEVVRSCLCGTCIVVGDMSEVIMSC
jgi:hypothetical protein